MALITDAELRSKVKRGLGITTDYQDDLLDVFIEEVKDYMISAGVPATVCTDSASVGCILQGVNDLWNYSAGSTKFSDYFKERVIQLALTVVAVEVSENVSTE